MSQEDFSISGFCDLWHGLTAPDGDCHLKCLHHMHTHTYTHQLWSTVAGARLNILYLIGRQNRGCIIKSFPLFLPSPPPGSLILLCAASPSVLAFSKQHIVFDQPCIVNAAHLISATLICQTGGKSEGQTNYTGIITAPFHHFIQLLLLFFCSTDHKFYRSTCFTVNPD